MSARVSNTMMSIPLRVAAVMWGTIELMGFLWIYVPSLSTWSALYWAAPAFGLIIGATIPNRALGIAAVRYGVGAILGVGIARRVHSMFDELAQTVPPDVGAACLQLISVLLLIGLIFGRVFKRSLLGPGLRGS